VKPPPSRARQEAAAAALPSKRGPLHRLVHVALVLHALMGFLSALYLTLVHYRGGIPRCYVVQGCDIVQTSKYSAILGVPIALFGAVYFTAMFYLAIGLLTSPAPRLVLSYRLLSYAGALAAIPLFLLQAVVLRAFCTYCLITEVILLLLWVGSFAVKPASPAQETVARHPSRRGKATNRSR
jgi:uncharacterized membrane protein